MSLGIILAIIAGVILAVVFGVLLGIFVFVNYMTSPSGFVKDLTGNVPPPPPQPMDPNIMRMHVEALQAEEDKDVK